MESGRRCDTNVVLGHDSDLRGADFGERAAAAVAVAAAVLASNPEFTRTTPISGEKRAPYCLMGTCFECLMEIDGEPNRQACMMVVTDGMVVKRQTGKREMPE